LIELALERCFPLLSLECGDLARVEVVLELLELLTQPLGRLRLRRRRARLLAALLLLRLVSDTKTWARCMHDIIVIEYQKTRAEWQGNEATRSPRSAASSVFKVKKHDAKLSV